MPPIPRRPGLLGLTQSAFSLWKRLPPEQRREILKQVRTHGPRVLARGARVAQQAGREAVQRLAEQGADGGKKTTPRPAEERGTGPAGRPPGGNST